MASPQIENGYVKIANELFDALCKIRISGETRQVFDVILRKTYGFNKKKDVISYSQFSEITGMSRQSSIKATRKLIGMNLVSVTNNGNSKSYQINKDFDTWRPLPKKATVTNNGNSGVTNNGNGLLPIMVTKVLPKISHTKDNKDTFKDSVKYMANTLTHLFPNYSDLQEIWIRTYGKNPVEPECDFINEVLAKFGKDKTINIFKSFKSKSFFGIERMRSSLNEDGSIKPKPKNGWNEPGGIIVDKVD